MIGACADHFECSCGDVKYSCDDVKYSCDDDVDT